RTKGVDLRQTEGVLARLDGASVSPVFIAVDRDLLGLLVYADPLGQEAPAVVRALRARGVREVAMLTGDRPAGARRGAGEPGIDRRWRAASRATWESIDFSRKSCQRRSSTSSRPFRTPATRWPWSATA